MAEFYRVKNQKGNENLISENYIFNFYSSKDGLEVWRCVKMSCRILGHITNDNVFVLHKRHNHDNEKGKILRKQLLKTVLEESVDSGRPAMEIITKNTANMDDAAIKELFTHKYMLGRISSIKNRHFGLIRGEIDDIPEFLKADLNGNCFLRYDNRSVLKRVLIFFSDFAKPYLANCEVLLVDGTFWSVPSKFTQLITFKAKIFGNLLPLIYILLPDKAEETYIEAFSILKTLITINGRYIITDFELALINALKKTLDSTLGGCSFHLGQAVYRNIQRLGLATTYKNDNLFRRLIKMILNLAYVPVDHVFSMFTIISTKLLDAYPESAQFINYFKKQYVRYDLKSPTYAIEFCNCYERVIKGLPRTINSLEGWHRALNALSPVAHVNVGKFVDILRQLNEKNRVLIIQSRKRIVLSDRDFKKESLLIEVLKSFEFYQDLEFFDSLSFILFWKLDSTDVL